jgi:hypothetical protein
MGEVAANVELYLPSFFSCSLFEEDVTQVRAVDVGVAVDALLNPRILTMPNGRRSRVALQAERVRSCACQHAWIGGTVREVARRASLNLDRFVLEDERPTLVAMALEADRILIRRRPKLAGLQSSMWIVAIIALDQSLFHAMMKWLLEVGFLFGMAREAQRRLLLHQ